MKGFLPALAAAGVLLASSAHAISPGEVQHMMVSARSAADARLNRAGVVLGDKTLAVEMTVMPMGALSAAKVVSSSGSPETDAQVSQALRRLRVSDLPPDLIGARLTLMLGRPDLVQARAW